MKLLNYEQYDEDTEWEIMNANMPVEFDEVTGEELPRRVPRDRTERAMALEEEREEKLRDAPRTEKPDDGLFMVRDGDHFSVMKMLLWPVRRTHAH